MQPHIIAEPKSHFISIVLLNCHFVSKLSLDSFFFHSLWLPHSQFSINTLIYRGNATGHGIHTQVPVVTPPSSLLLPNNDPIHPFAVCLPPPPSLGSVRLCNLDKLTGLHSGVMTARRSAFLSFTFVWIALVSGHLPSTAS